MVIFFYSLLTLFAMFYLGYGITAIIIPNKLKGYAFWFTPWYGTIYLIVFSVLMSSLGLPMKIIAPAILVFSSILNGYILFLKKNILKFDRSEDFLTAFLILFSIFFNLYPLIRLVNYPTTISFGNNDIGDYVGASDFLLSNSLLDAFITKASFGADNMLVGAFRWGPNFIYSFFQYLFRLKAYQISYIVQVTFFSLAVSLTYILVKYLYKKSIMTLILSFILTAFNVNLLYMLYHNFFPHILFRGLTIFLLIHAINYFYSNEKSNQDFSQALVISLGLSTIYFSYQEIAPFFVIPFALFFIFKLILREKTKELLNKLIGIALITLTMSLPSIIYSFRFLVNMLKPSSLSNLPIGWQVFRSEVPFANPFEALGFYSIHSYPPLPSLIAIFFSLLVIVILVIGFLKIRYKLLIFSFLIIFIGILLKAIFINQNFFDYARIISYTLPIFISILVIGFESSFKKNKTILYSIVVLMVISEFFMAYKLVKRFVSEGLTVNKQYISLQEIQKEKQFINEPLYLENDIKQGIPFWNYMWLPYFLNLNRIPILPVVAESGKKLTVPENSLVLVHKPNTYVNSPRIVLKDIIWENDYFRIGRLCSNDQCLMSSSENLSTINFGLSSFEDSLLLSGWSASEPENRWTEGKQSSLRLINNDGVKSKIIIEALTLKSPQIVTITIDGEYVGSFSPSEMFGKYVVEFKKPLPVGSHSLLFSYAHTYKPSEISRSADNRDLAVNFKRISLE